MFCLCGVYVTDSFCGVSVCLVKLRRLTVWWRPSPPATATATSMSSSQLVGFNMHSIFILPVWDCVWESGGCFFLITTPSLYFWYSRLPSYFFLCFLLVTDSVFLYSVPKMHMWNTGSGFLLFFVCVCIFLLTPDTCYILSFAIIMLNTSLHNPNVKDKTTLERFISMNRGINNGEDLPNDLLSVRTSQKHNHSAHVDAKKQLPKWTHS